MINIFKNISGEAVLDILKAMNGSYASNMPFHRGKMVSAFGYGDALGMALYAKHCAENGKKGE